MTSGQIADALSSLVPAKERILRAAARLPPRYRSRQSCRVFGALARRTKVQRAIRTNLGIASTLACDVPPTELLALYGLPALYEGERGALELAAQLTESCDAFVDVGANLGYFTFFVRMRAVATLPIYYFEPDPTLYAALDRNVQQNSLGRTEGCAHAVGADDGTACFYVNRTDRFSGSLKTDFADRHDVVPVDVRTERFSTLARRLDIHRGCVKVDVEGAEFDFLTGASGALDRIRYLIIEVLGPAQRQGFTRALMTAGRFHAYYINDYSIEPAIDGQFTYHEPEYNWLFCRESPAELAAQLRPPLEVRGEKARR